MHLELTTGCLRSLYAAIATVVSLIFGIFADKLHGVTKPTGWPLAYSIWFNSTGAATGWLSGWVVLIRWLSCPGYVCSGEPKGWTILLAVIAFVGISGYLPLSVITSIGYLRAVINKLIQSLGAPS